MAFCRDNQNRFGVYDINEVLEACHVLFVEGNNCRQIDNTPVAIGARLAKQVKQRIRCSRRPDLALLKLQISGQLGATGRRVEIGGNRKDFCICDGGAAW